MKSPTLALVPFGSWCSDDDRVFFTEKFVSGLQAIAERWPGNGVVVAQRRPGAPDVNLGSRWFSADELPMEIRVTDEVGQVLSEVRPDLISGGLEYAQAWLANSSVPVVYTCEFTAAERLRNTLRTTSRPLDRLRVVAGAARQAWALRQMVTSAAGLQCNGWPTYEAFRGKSDRCLLFYDTRLQAGAVKEPRARQAGRLTVSFSGRLVELKGPLDAVAAVRMARDQGHDVRLRVYGEGPLSEQVANALGAEDEFAGTVDFDREWLVQVHEDIDLMLLPYRQGDPAGTFMEAAGVGVPTLGYDSVALDGLVREEGIGWTVGVGDVEELARQLGRLSQTPDEVQAAGNRGTTAMRSHHSDAEFDRRVEHLLRCMHDAIAS